MCVCVFVCVCVLLLLLCCCSRRGLLPSEFHSIDPFRFLHAAGLSVPLGSTASVTVTLSAAPRSGTTLELAFVVANTALVSVSPEGSFVVVWCV